MKLLLAPLALAFAPTASSQCSLADLQVAPFGSDLGRAVAVLEVAGVLHALASTPGDNTFGPSTGAVVSYSSTDGGITWSSGTLIGPATPTPDAEFGFALASDPLGRLFVGAPGSDFGLERGAVHVFELDGSGAWVESQLLQPTDNQPAQRFGSALSVERLSTFNNTIQLLVGAPDHAGVAPAGGAVFAYRSTNSTQGVLDPLNSYVFPQASPGDRFGASVAFTNPVNFVVQSIVGVPGSDEWAMDGGAVWKFNPNFSFPTSVDLTGLQPGDAAGSSLAEAGLELLIGVPGRDGGAVDSGAVFAVPLGFQSGSAIEEIEPDQATAGGRFGLRLRANPVGWRYAATGSVRAAPGGSLELSVLGAIGSEDDVSWNRRSDSQVLGAGVALVDIAPLGDSALVATRGPLGARLQWLQVQGRDANANRLLDECEIAANPGLDANGDGFIDQEAPSIEVSFTGSVSAQAPDQVVNGAGNLQFSFADLSAGYIEDGDLAGTFIGTSLHQVENLNLTEDGTDEAVFLGEVSFSLGGPLALNYFDFIDDCGGCPLPLAPFDGVVDFDGASGRTQDSARSASVSDAWLVDGENYLIHNFPFDTETLIGTGTADVPLAARAFLNNVAPIGPGPFEFVEETTVNLNVEVSYTLYPYLLDGQVQQDYCSSTANSTGLAARLQGAGSAAVAANLLVLQVDELPAGQPGYFLGAQQTANLPGFGGSQGTLCLGGSILRFDSDVLVAGVDGFVQSRIDLLELVPPFAVSVGDTRYFQYWFRDLNPGATSNTSNGLSIIFQ